MGDPHRLPRWARGIVIQRRDHLLPGRPGRGKGLGKKLVSHLEEVALEQRIQHIIVILLDDNLPSQRLLHRMRYEVWANFEGIAHFPDGDRGHMYMGKHLIK